MAKMQNLVACVAVLILAICRFSEALSCYACLYIEVNGESFFDEGCGLAGEIPDERYLVNCTDHGGRRGGGLPGRPGIQLGDDAPPSAPPAEANVMGCIYVHGAGIANSDQNFSGVFRSCYATPDAQFENCEKKTFGRWGDGRDNWSYAVHGIYAFFGLADDGLVDACYCAGEECNTNIGSGCNNKA